MSTATAAASTAQNSQEETPWVAIFRAGKYPQGDFDEAALDGIVSRYNPVNAHEAPISLDHEDKGPALGWVSSLKRVGDLLYARFRQVSDDFKEKLRSGSYKKPSVEIYKNYEGQGVPYLRAVTFLGAQSPAVKGLPQAVFLESAGQFVTVTCKDQEDIEMAKDFAAQLEEKDNELARFREEQQKQAEALKAKDDELVRFREEQQRQSDALKAKDAELAKVQQENRRKEIAQFFDTQVSAGKALPAWKDGGIIEFMQSLSDENNQALATFAENAGQAGAGQTMSQRAWFTKFMQALPEIVIFGETITKERAAKAQGIGGADSAGERLDKLTVVKMQDRKDLTYRQAFHEVQKENPSLAAAYAEQMAN